MTITIRWVALCAVTGALAFVEPLAAVIVFWIGALTMPDSP